MKKILLFSILFLFAIIGNSQAPTIPSSNLAFNLLDGNRLRYSFTKGDGEKRLIIAKVGSPVTAEPTDGVDYISGNFGLGNEIAPGEFVVYEGLGFSNIFINGLIPNTTYYIKIFEFNGGNSTTEYLTSATLEGSATTLSAPTTQASGISFSNVLGESMTVSWIPGDGDGRILIIREGAAVDTEPINLINYNASGNAIGNASYQIGVGNYVMFNQSGSSVNITNLNPNTTYYFALFEYNGSSGKVFLNSTSSSPTPGAIGSQLTTAAPSLNSTGMIANYFDGNRLRFNFTKGNGGNRIIVVKEGSPVDVSPADGVDYYSNSTFGLGDDLGGGNYIVYDGSGGPNNFVNGLNHSTIYYAKVFEYNGSGSNTYYLNSIDINANPVAEGSGTTLTYPTVQASNITFSNVTGTSMKLNWTAGDGDGRILIARAGSPVDTEPISLVNYNAGVNSFGNNSYQIGTGNYVLYNSSGTSATIGNLDLNITYYFALFEYNGSTGNVFLTSTSPSPAPGATGNQLTPTFPTLNATNLSFNYFDGNRLRFAFTNGNGANRIVVVKQGSPVDAIPVDGVDYTPNSTFGSGDDLGGGNYVIYDGSYGSNNFVNGLDHSTNYYVKVFEYNGTNSETSYLITDDLNSNPVPDASGTTLTYPTVQASNITFSNILGETMTASWTNGNGDGRILIIREDSPVDIEPTSLVNYNATPGSIGNASYEIGTGNYVLYNSSGSSVNITNLDPNTTYYFALFEYNGSTGKVFLTSESTNSTPGATANQLTPAYPTINAANVSFSNIDVDRLRYTFSNGNGARRIVVAKEGSPVDALPIDGQDYTFNTTFGLGDDLGGGNFVVYDGSYGTGTYVYGLNFSTSYYLKVFEYNGILTETFYLKTNDSNTNPVAEGGQSTLLIPTIQASNISFTNVNETSMTLNWTNGDGSGRILIARAGSPVDVEPESLINYNASTNGFGNSTYQIGTGNYVLYQGSGSQVTIGNLAPNITYHFALFEYTGSSKKLYLTSTSSTPLPGATAYKHTGSPPTVNATNFGFSNIDGDRLQFNFTNGGGEHRIIIARQGLPVSVNPTDGFSYESNSTFGLGQDMGDGNFVVYDGNYGSGSFVEGLDHSTNYYFKIFEYNGDSTETFYLTVFDIANIPPAEANQSTQTYPSAQPGNISFSGVLGESMILSWNKGDGQGRILIAREGSPVDVEPEVLTNYNSNSTGMGNVVYEIGSGNYVLYQGTGPANGPTNLSISNLLPNTTYYFALFEYNGSNGKVYLTSTSPVSTPATTANQTSATYPTLPANLLSFNSIDGNQFKYVFGYGNGARRIVVAKAGSPVDAVPVDGQDYAYSTYLGSGDDLGGGNFVVYDGSGGNGQFLQGLNPSSLYYLKIFEYNGTGSNTYYLISPAVTGNQSTLSAPTIQASNANTISKTSTSINLSWTNGNGNGRLLVARADSAVDVEITDLQNYNGNSNYGYYDMGNGNYAIYSGSLNADEIMNLEPNVNYHFALFEYNGNSGKIYLKPAYTFEEQTWGVRPFVQSSNAIYDLVGASSMKVLFTKGDGLRRLVLAKEGSPVDADPEDLLSYVASSVFGSGDELGTGNFVVYNGSGNSFPLTNLDISTTYYFSFYEYGIDESGELYLSPGYTSSKSTATPPTLLPTNLTVNDFCTNFPLVQWDIDLADPNTGEGRLVVISEEPLNAVPVATVNYIADFDYGQGSPLGNGFVMYKGSGILFPPNLLQEYTNYYVNLFEYNGIEEDPAFNTTPLQSYIGDSIPPTMLCKNTFAELDESGNVTIVSADVDDGSFDNCGINLLTIDISSFSCADLGEQIVTLTATDFYGNSNSCQSIITVQDNIFPSLSVAEDIVSTSSADGAGNCDLLIAIPDAVYADNCESTLNWEMSGATNDSGIGQVGSYTFPVGVTTITYTNTDADLNATSDMVLITVSDNENPTITCQDDNSQAADPGECTASVAVSGPIAIDNCAIASVINNYNGTTDASDAYPIGNTTVVWTATDIHGNSTQCSQIISVFDNEDPSIISLPVDISVNNDPFECGAIVSWTEPTADDNCLGSSISQTEGSANGSLFPIGLSTVTYTSTDAFGNTHADSFTVTVIDNEDPIIVDLPTTISVNNDPANCGAIVNWIEPTSDDNCPGSTIIQSAGPANGTLFPIATTSVVYTATDAHGNQTFASFDVTVSDTEKPTIIDLPSDITVDSDPASCGAIVNWIEPSGQDNCPGSTISQIAGQANGSQFPIGSTTISYTLIDAYGNSSIGSFDVTVNDNENPTIQALPADITTSNDIGSCGAFVNWTEPTSDDNCIGSTIAQTAGPANGSLFPMGLSIVAYTAVDAYGNSSEASFSVTVSDEEVPTIIGLPADIILSNDAGTCGAVASWTEPTSNDNCPGSTISQTSGPANGSLFSIGISTITYQASDAYGNTYEESFTITVNDTEAPTISIVNDFDVNPDTGCDFSIPDYSGLANTADNCGILSIIQDPAAGSVLNGNGNTQLINLTVNDVNGNSSITSFTITLQGTEVYYADADQDGYGDDGNSILDCSQPVGYVSNNMDCNDANEFIYPGAEEICDGIDNNCDGLIDDEDPLIVGQVTWYQDFDGDDYGNAAVSILSCDQALGYVQDNTDCDDNNLAVNPAAIEIPANGIDDDCNPATLDGDDNDGDGIINDLDPDDDNDGCLDIDDPNPFVASIDLDGDGVAEDCDVCLGDDALGDSDGDGICDDLDLCAGGDDNLDGDLDGTPDACDVCPLDYFNDSDGDGICDSFDQCPGSNDLADTDGDGIPDGCDIEECDGVDNDGDGFIDEGFPDTDNDGIADCIDNLNDQDGDGFDALVDCDDNNAAVYPGALEICDGLDNNCDGFIDEGLSTDADGDGHYAIGSCLSPADDCDDTNATVYPGAVEICDGLDNNCDGIIDEGLSTDADGDGHYAVGSCLSPADDCDDTNATVYPGAVEICDGLDNNCDGIIDEGLSTDADGDGHYAIGSCLSPADDCDDTNATVYPGAVEICDGLDNNCDGLVDEGLATDADGDGHYAIGSCLSPADDCDDTNATVYPGAVEICDGLDNNCDGLVDEGLATDADGDGHYAIGSCLSPADDCDDTNATVYPGAVEICDGLDNNCDGIIDEGLATDADGDGHYAIGSCLSPADDCDDTNATVYPGAVEICDGLDNNCDGLVDEGLATDADGDGHYAIGSCLSPADDCDDTNATVYPGAVEICDGLDNNCDGSIDEGLSTDADGDGHYAIGSCLSPADDCDDTNATVYPGAVEICDGLDNNCDGIIDEGLATDADGDGHYAIGSCLSPADDCDDTNATVYPGAVEICDGLDNNCDGIIDEGLATDADGDGHYAIGSCLSPADDCNDTNATVYPGAVEICDGLDNDCNGLIDNDDPSIVGQSTYYADNDGDGFGDPNNTVLSCSQPSGFVSDASDCDDTNNNVYPGAAEICDGLDNDCNGLIDNDDPAIVGQNTYYADADGDGFGDPSNAIQSCSQPFGYVIDATDCDDSNSNVYPDAPEICDGLDNNCDGIIDEGLSTDADGDGHYAIGSCLSPADDCDDTNATVYPGAVEICDGLDNNCDGIIDEGLATDADGDGHYAIGSCLSPADDCDDTNATVYPGAVEICDGLDNNCDGLVDEGLATDADGDGHYAIGSCLSPADDCDDTNAAVYPGAIEICDGIDNDCDGLIDDEDPSLIGQLLWYADTDGDGFGDPTVITQSCSQPFGYVSDNTDCDDSDATVNSNATEILYNGKDDDCDPSTLDTEDIDGDGFNSDVDCDDLNPDIYPGAIEIPGNDVDEDCDGIDNDDENECSSSISGNLHINPSMSSNNKFIMETPDGTINMNLLANQDDDYSYFGSATSIKIKVKGSGKILTVNGVDITLQTNIRYEFTGDMMVSLVNTSPNNCSNPNGFWWIDIEGAEICSFPDLEETSYCSNNIVGILNINPSMSVDNMFIMETPDGMIDMESLADEGATYSYSGDASSVKIMVKGLGRFLWINGSCFWLETNVRYEFTGDLNVCLLNTKSWSSWNKAKGHWWLALSGNNICISPEIDTDKDQSTDNTYFHPMTNEGIDLVEIYPNPFMHETNISFEVKEESEVSIIVYDAYGRTIKVLQNGKLDNGFHQLQWDGRNAGGDELTNGLYFIQVKTATYNNSFRVILNH